MNLLLVDQVQDSYEISGGDPRLAAILRLQEANICIGVVNGLRGVGVIRPSGDEGVRIENIRWEAECAGRPPVDLFVGLPRPVVARRILVHASSIGVRRIVFAVLDRTPPGYRASRALAGKAIEDLLREGLEQGFHTALPEVGFANGLDGVLSRVDPGLPVSFLDPYLGKTLLGEGADGPDLPGTIVMGSERGFSAAEQERIRRAGVRLRHLGPSILRTEAAVIAALAIAHRQTGYFSSSARSVIGRV